jgi:hypothetical protein
MQLHTKVKAFLTINPDSSQNFTLFTLGGPAGQDRKSVAPFNESKTSFIDHCFYATADRQKKGGYVENIQISRSSPRNLISEGFNSFLSVLEVGSRTKISSDYFF